MIDKNGLRHFIQTRLILCLLLLIGSAPLWAEDWKTIAPGIEYLENDGARITPWSHIHGFRIDLKKNEMDLVLANDFQSEQAWIDEFAAHSEALISLNGGFFDQSHHPLGLRIGKSKQQNPLKRISWWGVFYIQKGRAHLVTPKQFQPNPSIEFAVQSGPRLIINGKIPSLKPGLAERTALGITTDNKVIILVTENVPMSTHALATLLLSPPFQCRDALNLDGGNSTQLKARLGAFRINVHGYSQISDAVVIRKRN